MKVLFTHSYFYQFDPKQWRNKTPYPPLGTITAASFIRSKGHDVALFDTALEPDESGFNDALEKEQPDVVVIYDDGFNYLTKMCLTNMREAAFRMAKTAQEKGITVLVNSSDSTDHSESYLSNGCTAVIKGEGEHTLLECLEAISKNESLDQIKGLVFKSGNETKSTPPRPVSRDLDEFPQAAWDLIDIDNYRAVWNSGRHSFTLNVATTRGCPFKCNWCAKPIYGNRYNSRSPEKVVDEIELHVKTHGVNQFWMADDIFGLKPGWVQAFNAEIQKRNLKIHYTIQSRADLLLQDDNLEVMAESGLREVWMGAESGSQKILDAMDKGTTIEQIEEATRKLKSKGIRAAFFLQFGYLDETKKDIELTIDMVKRLKPDNIGVSVSYPLPGTPFYDRVKHELAEKSNWTDSDELALMFQNTFNPEYYKTLHRYIHKLYRWQQGWRVLAGKDKTLRSAVLLPYYGVSGIAHKLKLSRLENVN